MLLFATLVGAAACFGTSSDTATTTTTTPSAPACDAELRFTHGEGGCLGFDDAWTFKGDVTGCATTVELDLWRTEGEALHEVHPMRIHFEGPDRSWQGWEGGPLAHGSTWAAGTATALHCQDDAGRVTFALSLRDGAGVLRDCAVWGHDAAGVVAGAVPDAAGFDGCVTPAW